MISVIRKAYLAGFLDGDGSIYVRAKPSGDYRFGFQVAPYIVLFQSAKNRKLFENICALIPYGRLRERKDGMLEYTINKIADIEAFLDLVAPYVILKQDQVTLMRKILKQKKLVETEKDFAVLLRLIEEYRSINYSTKRKKRILTP